MNAVESLHPQWKPEKHPYLKNPPVGIEKLCQNCKQNCQIASMEYVGKNMRAQFRVTMATEVRFSSHFSTLLTLCYCAKYGRDLSVLLKTLSYFPRRLTKFTDLKPPGPVLKGIVNKSMEFWRRATPTADDSGIDSDDEHRVAYNMAFVNDVMQTTESSSSSEEDGFRFRIRMPQVMPKFRRYREYGNNNESCIEDVESDDNAGTQQREEAKLVRSASYELHNNFPEIELDTSSKKGRNSDDDIRSDNGRDSPSLLEVELTASDEDDETSVLELVIPMKQNMRYQRVPSNKASNPKKRSACVFWIAFLCCVPRKPE